MNSNRGIQNLRNRRTHRCSPHNPCRRTHRPGTSISSKLRRRSHALRSSRRTHPRNVRRRTFQYRNRFLRSRIFPDDDPGCSSWIKNRWRYQPTHDWGLHLKIYFYFWDSGTGNLSYMILNIFFFGDNNILWTEDIGYNIVSTVPD